MYPTTMEDLEQTIEGFYTIIQLLDNQAWELIYEEIEGYEVDDELKGLSKLRADFKSKLSKLEFAYREEYL